MADRDYQQDREDGGSQSREFVDRLTRRLTDPVGVIDVRFAQQKYARIVEWLAERFALADLLHARYGADEGIAADWQTADWQTMVMQQSAGEQINLFSTSTQSFFPGMAAQPFGNDRAFSSEAPSSLADDSLSTPEPKYRISRRRQPIDSSFSVTSSEHPSNPAAQPTSTTASGSRPQEAVEPIKQSDDVPHAIEVPFATRTLSSLVFAEPLTEPEDKSQTNAQNRFESREAAPSPGGATDNDVSSPSTRTGSEVAGAPSGPSITPLPLAGPRGDQSVPPDTSRLPASSRGEASEYTRDSSLPLARLLAEPQRADDRQQPGPRQSNESAPAAQDTRKIAVASEVRDVPDGALSRAIPDIVWRKNSESQAVSDSSSFEQGRQVTDSARQVNNSADSVRAQQTTIDRAVPENLQPRDEPNKAEIRIEQLSPQVIRTISERVIRAISLDLKVERERRGISKWR